VSCGSVAPSGREPHVPSQGPGLLGLGWASGPLFKGVQTGLLKDAGTLPGVNILQIFFSHLRKQLKI